MIQDSVYAPALRPRPLLVSLLIWALCAAAVAASGVLMWSPLPVAQLVAAVEVLLGWQFLRAFRKPVPFTLRTLTLFQGWRLIPATGFLIAARSGALPREFALEAGIGDLIISLLAFAIAELDMRKRKATQAWNYAGILDLLLVLVGAAIFTHAGEVRMDRLKVLPLAMLPLFLVPLSILVHIASLRMMKKQKPTGPPSA